MATERKHLAVHLEEEVYDQLDRLREKDRNGKLISMSKYAGRILAEYISKERWRLKEKKYSVDTDFE